MNTSDYRADEGHKQRRKQNDEHGAFLLCGSYISDYDLCTDPFGRQTGKVFRKVRCKGGMVICQQ